MSRREENRRAAEQHLYQTALKLFCDQGYRQTTLVDIAAEAEVSTRTLYRYYPTKESILRRFCQENIMALKAFVQTMDMNESLFDRVIDVMMKDYSLMFGVFDPGHILHYTRDPDGILNRFEIENIMEMESIYCTILKHEQVANGIAPNDNLRRCASIIAAIYRHCNDIFRFRNVGNFDEKALRTFYVAHLAAIWDSLYATLLDKEGDPRPIGSSGDLYPMPS